MGQITEIAWCDHTHNVVWGCTKVSEACHHCYAETWSKRMGLKVWGQDAPRRTFGAKHWNEPRKWNKAAQEAGERRRVFCSSMADVFEDHATVAEARAQLWPLISDTPWLDWLLLTKRPENFAGMVPWGKSPPANVWLGVTAENQERANERIPLLLAQPATVRFVSAEPLLGPVDLSRWLGYSEDWDRFIGPCAHGRDPWTRCDEDACTPPEVEGISWVIVGGESGHHARPFEVEWARSLVRQCREAKIAPFVKQMGFVPIIADPVRIGLPRSEWPEMEWPEGTRFGNPTGKPEITGRVVMLKDAKGGDMSEWPDAFQVREFPEART